MENQIIHKHSGESTMLDGVMPVDLFSYALYAYVRGCTYC